VAESTDSTQRSKSNGDQHKNGDILTICDSSKSGEPEETDTYQTTGFKVISQL